MLNARRILALGLAGTLLVVGAVLTFSKRNGDPTSSTRVEVSSKTQQGRRALKPAEVGFEMKDGLELAATLYENEQASAPLVVMLHQWGGQRDEFRSAISAIQSMKTPVHVLLLDQRGHGHSTKKTGQQAVFVEHTSMTDADRDLMVSDVSLAVLGVEARLKTRVPAVVLVGSDYGATVAVRAASQVPRLVGLALISPGAKLKNTDIYGSSAGIVGKHVLAISAANDNVSNDVASALSRMAKDLGRFTTLDGNAHGARALSVQNVKLWPTLTDWLDTVLQYQKPNSNPEVPAPSATGSDHG